MSFEDPKINPYDLRKTIRSRDEEKILAGVALNQCPISVQKYEI